MNNFILNTTYNFIKKNTHYTEYELLKIKYGLEGIYLTISKVLIILLIGIIFKYLETVIITLLFFNFLRFFAFGVHAKNSWQCLITSILQFNILPFLLLKITIKLPLIIIISIFAITSFLLFAPSDTEKRPLTNKNKRIIRKICSLILGVLFFVIAIYFDKLRVPILSSLIIESIVINPLCYKLLGVKYNNYKNS